MRAKILAFLLTVCSTPLFSEKSDSILILNMPNESKLPRNFRSVLDPFKEQEDPLPSTLGLKTLNISGSAQFSEKSLDCILETIKHPENFYMLDLREEYHGFVNGAAISWFAIRDWQNVGKTQSAIERVEKQLLADLLHKEVSFSTVVEKDPLGLKMPKMLLLPPVKVEKASTEETLSKERNLIYTRLPVTDQVKPGAYQIDRFIDFVKTLPANSWLHMHCVAGIGRTTTFMAMYDILKNAKKVSFEDITKRQQLIGGRNLFKPSRLEWKNKLIEDRHLFLREFYEYCKNNQDDYETSWSLYLLEKELKKPIFL